MHVFRLDHWGLQKVSVPHLLNARHSIWFHVHLPSLSMACPLIHATFVTYPGIQVGVERIFVDMWVFSVHEITAHMLFTEKKGRDSYTQFVQPPHILLDLCTKPLWKLPSTQSWKVCKDPDFWGIFHFSLEIRSLGKNPSPTPKIPWKE